MGFEVPCVLFVLGLGVEAFLLRMSVAFRFPTPAPLVVVPLEAGQGNTGETLAGF